MPGQLSANPYLLGSAGPQLRKFWRVGEETELERRVGEERESEHNAHLLLDVGLGTSFICTMKMTITAW